MARWIGLALTLGALAGCGQGYPTNGRCARDADCQLCEVCGCTKAYARADTAGASCSAIQSGSVCPKGLTADCMSGPLNALCVGGQCQAVTSLR